MDLTGRQDAQAGLAGPHPTHVFFTAWSRRTTEEENITVNAARARDVLDAARHR